MECDFCGSPDPHWVYPARAFVAEERVRVLGIAPGGIPLGLDIDILNGYDQTWRACHVCHALISRGDRDRLARRSAKRILRHDGYDLPFAQVETLVRRLHDRFWSNREGPPTFHPDRVETR